MFMNRKNMYIEQHTLMHIVMEVESWERIKSMYDNEFIF